MKKILLFLVFFLLSCSSAPLTFAVDSKFTDNEKAIIMACVEEWMIATDSNDAAVFFRFDLKRSEPFLVDKHWDADQKFGLFFKVSTSDPGYKDLGSDNYPYGYRGLARTPDRIVIVSELTRNQRIFKETVMHELGHVYGLPHLDIGLMAVGDPTSCVDEVTLEAFCDIHECGPKARPTCI